MLHDYILPILVIMYVQLMLTCRLICLIACLVLTAFSPAYIVLLIIKHSSGKSTSKPPFRKVQ